MLNIKLIYNFHLLQHHLIFHFSLFLYFLLNYRIKMLIAVTIMITGAMVFSLIFVYVNNAEYTSKNTIVIINDIKIPFPIYFNVSLFVFLKIFHVIPRLLINFILKAKNRTFCSIFYSLKHQLFLIFQIFLIVFFSLLNSFLYSLLMMLQYLWFLLKIYLHLH